jgi:hypothetical protein
MGQDCRGDNGEEISLAVPRRMPQRHSYGPADDGSVQETVQRAEKRLLERDAPRNL